MTELKVNKASREVHALDKATQELIESIRLKDARFRKWFIITWTILLLVGIFGIYKQNEIAAKNQKHIDCIVKLFTTPLPKSARSRAIENPSTTCNIKFTQ